MQEKVLNIVVNHFENDSRVIKVSSSLSRHGYKVQVAALHKDGLKVEEEFENLFSVYRFPLYFRKLKPKSFFRIFALVELILKIRARFRYFDIFHCNDLEGLIIGVLIKFSLPFQKIQIVYDAHEYESNCVPGQSPIKVQFLEIIERMFIRYADRMITVSDSLATLYSEVFKITRPDVILNCPPQKTILSKYSDKKLYKELNLRSDQKIILYLGGLSQGRSLDKMIEAFKLIKNDEYVLVFIGYGPLKQFIVENTDNKNIFFKPAVPPNEIFEYTQDAYLGLCLTEDRAVSYRYSLPNKVFEYAMSNVPIIAPPLPELSKIVKENNIGVVLKEVTPQAIIKTILNIDEHEYHNYKFSIKKFITKYNWENQEKKLIKLYKSFEQEATVPLTEEKTLESDQTHLQKNMVKK
ncbi:MAG: glycosyltransferase [Halobacteriovoraceae bacterium]|nr:glycosyltransferase [Halobacteriovoraceae bacterium]